MILLEDKNMLDFSSILVLTGGILLFVIIFVLVKRWERKRKERNEE